MYKVNVEISGTAPLLQHRFAPAVQSGLMKGSSKRTGSPDWSLEWMDSMYVTEDGFLYQPATHLEGALVNAAGQFKIKGARGKSWKDPMKAYVYISPIKIVHLRNGEPVKAPGAELLETPANNLSVSIMRARIQKAAVARSRLEINTGWILNFTLEVIDDQVAPEVVKEILSEAGRAVGIGDYRPRYGRFELLKFDVVNMP